MVAPSSLSAQVMLASSVHAQPGVYAVLIGSGVSTGAGLLTGWGIVKDLVRRVARLADDDDDGAEALAVEDPEKWWSQSHSEPLGYSSLLESLASTPAARQGLLEGYFDPSAQDAEDGFKRPSKAHVAIAQLVKAGYVRVILTTNFDRLMEQALSAVGVEAQVISRPEAVAGMSPLSHARATVVKLHGDYKDLESLNTAEELRSYPQAWNDLLQQIFNEYGLVISGWSAEWDRALVANLREASSRRYPLFWDRRSCRHEIARELLSWRQGRIIDAQDADALFGTLWENVQALDSMAELPLSSAMAQARLKKYLLDPVKRIDLYDLVMGEVKRVSMYLAAQPLHVDGLDATGYMEILDRHCQVTKPLLGLLSLGVFHDVDRIHHRLWVEVVQKLLDAGTARFDGPVQDNLDKARRYPALLAMTTMGIVGITKGDERLLFKLFTEPQGFLWQVNRSDIPAGYALVPYGVLNGELINETSEQKWRYPVSHYLKPVVVELVEDFVVRDRFLEAFNGYEYRLSLILNSGLLTSRKLSGYAGEFASYETGWTFANPRELIVEQQFRQAAPKTPDWPWFDALDTVGNHEEIIAKLNETLKTHRDW